MSELSNITIQGYRRENGRVGVRNHVLIHINLIGYHLLNQRKVAIFKCF